MGKAYIEIAPGRHPLHGLRRNLLQHHPDLRLEFSRYVHLGFGRTLSREIFHVEAKDVDGAWLEKEIRGLSQGQELALHSRVVRNDGIYHIPLVDFAEVGTVEILLDKTQAVSQSLPVNITLYNSGRSTHGYYFCLIDEKDWYRYLGGLLLCNPPSALEGQFVDSRWVGHSLEHGFSALRWSCNSAIYKSLPELVDIDSRGLQDANAARIQGEWNAPD